MKGGADRGDGLPITSRGCIPGKRLFGGGVGAIITTPDGPAETNKNELIEKKSNQVLEKGSEEKGFLPRIFLSPPSFDSEWLQPR